MRIQGLLLSAGRARRFGSQKLLHPVDGVPIAVSAASNLCAAGLPVLCVIRPGDVGIRAALELLDGVRVSACPTAESGMGHSLAWGVRESAGADAWIVALGDMPSVRPATIAAIAAALRAGAALVAPVYEGRRGHPVGFSAQWRAELTALSGDQGARRLLARAGPRLMQVAVDDPGILLDIDTPEDLALVPGAAGGPQPEGTP